MIRPHTTTLLAAILSIGFPGCLLAQPVIDSKNFAVNCQLVRGNTAQGLSATREMNSGFTIVLSDATQSYYNAPSSPGLRYWVVPGEISHLTPRHKPVVAFTTKRQKVQVYGGLQPLSLYTIFITYGNGTAKNSAARTVIKAGRCGPYVEPGIIPNELRHNRPLHMG